MAAILQSHFTSTPPVESEQNEIRFTGKVSRIVFHSPEDDYFIFSLALNGSNKQCKVMGYGFGLQIDREVECTGIWESSKNPKYPDPTLKATSIVEVIPATLEGIRKLLHGGFIKGIGKITTDLLLLNFGAELFNITEHHPNKLYQVKGIAPGKITALINGINEKKAAPRIMAYLAEIGLGSGLSHRVFKHLGPNAVDLIKQDPYCLTEVPLIGFIKADMVARNIGVEFDCEQRIRASLTAVLQKESEQGSTAVELSRMTQLMGKLLVVDAKEVSPNKIKSVIDAELVHQKHIILRDLNCGPCLSMRESVRQEKSIAYHMARIVTNYRGSSNRGANMSSMKFAHLDATQLSAARTALDTGFSVITGRPGCGKTTTTKSIVDVMVDAKMKVSLSAPTGRAAKKITESTGYLGVTNHRLLESQGAAGFKRHESNPLEIDNLLMDEVSMTDTFMMERTLRAIPSGAGMLLIGDVDQLSSIGEGNILSDVIKSGKVPVSILTKIHRQAANSSIISNAHKIIEGIEPDGVTAEGKMNDFGLVHCPDDTLQIDAVIAQFKALLGKGFSPEDIQILTPMRHKTDLGVNHLNRVLKDYLNPADKRKSIKIGKFEREMVFSEGDRVMQTANNKELCIYNGDIGYVLAADERNQILTVDFSGDVVELERDDLADLDLAYATTIHKSQGSEFPAVIIPLSKGHGHMWDRNLLYTAVTRARKYVSVVGDTQLLGRIVKKASASKRLTGLREEIVAMFGMLENKQEAVGNRKASRASATTQF